MPEVRPSQRLTWAVDVLAVQPDDHLLEIGCGHGVAVSLAADRLATGHITALDRSAKMIETARTRNAAHIAAGRVTLVCAALEVADVGVGGFDKIFAFHVADLWRRPENLDRVRDLLAPGGALYLFNQPPRPDPGFTGRLAGTLAEHGFRVRDVVAEGRATAVISAPGTS